MTTIQHSGTRSASLMILIAALAASLGAEDSSYREITGERERVVTAMAERQPDGSLVMEVDGSSGRHRVVLAADGSTRSWQASAPDGRPLASAERTSSGVAVTTARGSRVLKLGPSPWFQAPDWQLIALARAPAGSRQDYLTVDPETAEFREFSAANQGTETVKIGGSARPSIKVEVTVRGLPALFWRSTYWYDAATFEMLRFEGRRGGPASPLIIMEALDPARR